MIVFFPLNEPSSQLMTSWEIDFYSTLLFLKLSRNIGEFVSYGLNPQVLYPGS